MINIFEIHKSIQDEMDNDAVYLDRNKKLLKKPVDVVDAYFKGGFEIRDKVEL